MPPSLPFKVSGAGWDVVESDSQSTTSNKATQPETSVVPLPAPGVKVEAPAAPKYIVRKPPPLPFIQQKKPKLRVVAPKAAVPARPVDDLAPPLPSSVLRPKLDPNFGLSTAPVPTPAPAVKNATLGSLSSSKPANSVFNFGASTAPVTTPAPAVNNATLGSLSSSKPANSVFNFGASKTPVQAPSPTVNNATLAPVSSSEPASSESNFGVSTVPCVSQSTNDFSMWGLGNDSEEFNTPEWQEVYTMLDQFAAEQPMAINPSPFEQSIPAQPFAAPNSTPMVNAAALVLPSTSQQPISGSNLEISTAPAVSQTMYDAEMIGNVLDGYDIQELQAVNALLGILVQQQDVTLPPAPGLAHAHAQSSNPDQAMGDSAATGSSGPPNDTEMLGNGSENLVIQGLEEVSGTTAHFIPDQVEAALPAARPAQSLISDQTMGDSTAHGVSESANDTEMLGHSPERLKMQRWPEPGCIPGLFLTEQVKTAHPGPGLAQSSIANQVTGVSTPPSAPQSTNDIEMMENGSEGLYTQGLLETSSLPHQFVTHQAETTAPAPNQLPIPDQIWSAPIPSAQEPEVSDTSKMFGFPDSLLVDFKNLDAVPEFGHASIQMTASIPSTLSQPSIPAEIVAAHIPMAVAQPSIAAQILAAPIPSVPAPDLYTTSQIFGFPESLRAEFQHLDAIREFNDVIRVRQNKRVWDSGMDWWYDWELWYDVVEEQVMDIRSKSCINSS